MPDLGDVFSEDVVVSDQPQELVTRVYVAEYDANGNLPALPVMGEEYGDEWKPFAEVFGGSGSGEGDDREEVSRSTLD